MQTTVRLSKGAARTGHIIILSDDPKDFPEKYFSKEESGYIRNSLKAGNKTVVINQFSRYVYLLLLDNASLPLHQQLEKARRSGASQFSRIKSARIQEITITGKVDARSALAFTEGMVLGSYQFLKYRSNRKKEESSLKSIKLDVKGASDVEIQRLNIRCEAVFKARDLVNEPASFLTATELGRQFQAMGKSSGFKVQVLNKTRIRQMKMGGLMAVNQGSLQPPTFTIMEWKPKNAVNKKPYVLIGKGVVYDTGGMSLKPTPNSMDYMKCDMAGGAAIGGAMFAIAKAKIPVHVIGLVPATDNRPDGNAYVPGDVITMMSGKTVEVLNTDAEGRLILADALHYAKRYQPQLILEFSTLTGAAAAAIGPQGIVCMGEVDETTRRSLHDSGNMVYERLAEFPFWEEYDELLQSDIADLKNIGGPVAGAITAGRFLKHFTESPYMHFDIAAPAFSKSNDSYRGKNGTGVGVRLLFDFFSNLAGH